MKIGDCLFSFVSVYRISGLRCASVFLTGNVLRQDETLGRCYSVVFVRVYLLRETRVRK
jgi:hypothetical protein